MIALSNYKPVARILDFRRPADRMAEYHARRIHAREHAVQCAGLTVGGYSECFYVNTADFTALASSASEGSLLAGLNQQPAIPAGFLSTAMNTGKALRIKAAGVFSTTGTPTLIFQLRLGSTIGSSYLSGTSIGVTAALTTASGVTNAYWELDYELITKTPGQGSGNCTLFGAGRVWSPTGFASPFGGALEPTTPPTATWTSTIDGSVTNYLNLSATWSASSASNTITCKLLKVWADN